jgi:hypothetical protein
MKKLIGILMVLALVGFGGMPALAFVDDFNRPNSSDLGPNWTQQIGTMGISANQAASAGYGSNYATVNGFSGSYLSTQVSVDAHDINTGLAYVALMFGIANDTQSIFVKVQDQGGNGYFNSAFFYYGHQGSGIYLSLDTPFRDGRISAWASDADTIWLGIDSNFDSVFEQTYSDTGWSSKTLGTGVGLGMFGDVRADNFSTEGRQMPEPATMLLLGSGLVGLIAGRKFLMRHDG